ncbi:MAG TPA: AmmeMemoRadiSam system protein B [Sedimentisphaerales bacterium]|nr:AmmeMemoRadiSam system protein B [Sedimentisphaerales bacterium]
MQSRKPVVAGQFYPGGHASCVDEIKQCLEQMSVSESLPETIVAGIVPHAGWTFSGAPAALVFSAIKQRHEKVDTFVLFGAAHSYFGRTPAVYDAGSWTTPLGDIAIDEELAQSVLNSKTATSDTHAHGSEHSIEVQAPFIQHLFGEANILPILVPPTEEALALGECVGDIIAQSDKKVVCIGSTDLTHYGPRYGFTPMGTGGSALKWAHEVNDRKFIDLALALAPDGMLVEAAESGNACGAGAAAAAVAAAKKLGKTKGVLLAHTNSSEVMLREMGVSGAESVGYAAIVF